MTPKSLTLATHNSSLLLLNAETTVLTPHKSSGRDKKVVLECPRCCWIFEATKPDKQHPHCAFTKPETSKVKGKIIEEPHICRNPRCKKQFNLYWHKPAAQSNA